MFWALVFVVGDLQLSITDITLDQCNELRYIYMEQQGGTVPKPMCYNTVTGEKL